MEFYDLFRQVAGINAAKKAAETHETLQSARQRRIGTNIDLDTFNRLTTPAGEYTRPDLEFGGQIGAPQSGRPQFQQNAIPSAGNFGQPRGYRFSELEEVDGYAAGGEVGTADPMTADYALYTQAAKSAGLPVLSMQEAIPRMAQIRANKRAQLMQMISQGGTTGYAAGGEVDIDGALIAGPGTGKSDSIPAVVDGHQPAAVSNGEFHIPKHVVDYYGTKMLDALVEKARLAGKAKTRKGAINA